MTGDDVTRRDFLRLAAGGALLATGVGCTSGSEKPKSGELGSSFSLRCLLTSNGS